MSVFHRLPIERFCFTVALWLIINWFIASPAAVGQDQPVCDVVINSGISAGVTATVQTSRMGRSVVLIERGQHLGGMTTSGLGWTNTGNHAVIGGIGREFYRRIQRAAQVSE